MCCRQAGFVSLPDGFEGWLPGRGWAGEGRRLAEVRREAAGEPGAAGRGSDSKGGSSHTGRSRCTLPGTGQPKRTKRMKRLFPFRQNKTEKAAAHNSAPPF